MGAVSCNSIGKPRRGGEGMQMLGKKSRLEFLRGQNLASPGWCGIWRAMEVKAVPIVRYQVLDVRYPAIINHPFLRVQISGSCLIWDFWPDLNLGSGFRPHLKLDCVWGDLFFFWDAEQDPGLVQMRMDSQPFFHLPGMQSSSSLHLL